MWLCGYMWAGIVRMCFEISVAVVPFAATFLQPLCYFRLLLNDVWL